MKILNSRYIDGKAVGYDISRGMIPKLLQKALIMST